MLMTQIRNADLLTRRDHQPTADDCLLIRMWSSDSSLEVDASLVQSWLQICVDEYLKQPKEQVQIYRPVRRWKEEEPEWTLYRTRRAPSATTTGPMSYLPRESLREILVDVTQRHTSLRVYFIHGETGTGKSNFVVWLAGQLGMPVYNISLTSPMVQGDSSLGLFSETALKHWPCLVHIDEFDAAVEMWASRGESGISPLAYGVSLETFKELLDGNASMSNGIIIITGMTLRSLSTLPAEEAEQIRRRFHKEGRLEPFTVPELQSYVCQYMERFLEPNVDRETSSNDLALFGEAFVLRMDDRAVHAVEKALQAFLIKALYDGRLLKRGAPYTQCSLSTRDTTPGSASMRSSDRSWWDPMYTDIREYFLPLQVLQEYVAAGEGL